MSEGGTATVGYGPATKRARAITTEEQATIMAVDQAFTLAVEDFTITIMVTTEDIMAVIMGDTTVAITVAITVIISAFTCRGSG